MAVVISEVVTEVVLTRGAEGTAPSSPSGAASRGGGLTDDVIDVIVRRATERVVEMLRREWNC